MQFHSSVKTALTKLKERYPDLVIAAFGQTVFWDEPMKAVLIPMLKAYHSGARMIIGPHDADYFGKCPDLKRAERFVICEHNDGSTAGMWAAVGEMSTLFGAEVVPTYAKLIDGGVDFHKIKLAGDRFKNTIDRATTAWGWRGVVESGGGHSVFIDVKTRNAFSEIEKLLEWALNETTNHIEDNEAHRKVAEKIISDFRSFAQKPENSALAGLFQAMWPYFYNCLLGYVPDNINLMSTCELFRFNRRTCTLPRFKLVDYFLDPVTGPICRKAYSKCVAGSGIYELERFGEGALPFDLVVPGRGRATLIMRKDEMIVDFHDAIVVKLDSQVTSVEGLAEVIENILGEGVSLVGKAIANAFMFTSEFVFALNTQGSVYVPRTVRMARYMADNGIPVKLMPILRLHYHTWDSLKVADVKFKLPEHLAAGWNLENVTGGHFADTWEEIVRKENAQLQTLAKIKSTRELIKLLNKIESNGWAEKHELYVQAKRALLKVQRSVGERKKHAHGMQEEIKCLKENSGRLQNARGRLSRLVKSLRGRLDELADDGHAECEIRRVRTQVDELVECEMRSIDENLANTRLNIKERLVMRARIVSAYRKLELGPDARKAREIIAGVEAETQAAKLRLVSRAIRIIEGLPLADHRPAAWWLPVVSPDGEWFRAILSTTEVELEEML